MADLTYRHGVTLVESPDTPSLLRVTREDVTFYNGTAPDADEAQFPLNYPTLITNQAQLSALGKTGTLVDDLYYHFGEGGSAVIINRVEHSDTPSALQANLIGDPVERTGIYAAVRAKAITGYAPRVIVTAGNTGAWIEDGAMSVTIVDGGANLASAPTVTASGGGSDPGKELPTLTCELGTGADAGKVVKINIVTPGKKMSEAPTLTFSGGGSAEGKELPEAIVNIGDLTNAFIPALNSVAHAIEARAYINGPNTTNSEAVRFRTAVNSGRIMIIDPKIVKNEDGVPVVKASPAAWAGVRSRVVRGAEGVSGSVSNKPLRTVDGVSRTITEEDANYLNEFQVSTIINRDGWRTWGSRLAVDDPLWQFDSVRATADMINAALRDVYFRHVDRKFTKGNLRLMLEDGRAALRAFVLANHIYDFELSLSDLNVPTLNANGKVFLNVKFEPVGIMEQIHITTFREPLYYQLVIDEVNGLIENGSLSSVA